MRFLLLSLFVFLFWGTTSYGSELKVVELASPFLGSKLYVPNDGKPHPGILVLHGSEGGSLPYYQLEAQLLAAHGYSVLAYCWYNCAKNPLKTANESLENVDLNKTYRAFTWLKASPYVGNLKTAIFGVSRGAEQALILGWKTKAEGLTVPDALVVHAPSDTVVMGFSVAAMDKRCWICTEPGLACFNGSDDPREWDANALRWNLACGTEPKNPAIQAVHAWKWNEKFLTHGTRIEIELYRGPVFLAHGDKDELWSHKRTLAIQKTLESSGATPEVHIFPGEKHVFKPAAENQKREWLLGFLVKSLR